MLPALVLPLRNGLQLTISGEPTLRALGNFLKAAIVHLKNQRDIQKVALYTSGSFQGRVGADDCAISNPGDATGDFATTSVWLEALLDVFSRLDALEAIRSNLSVDRVSASSDAIVAVTGLLEQPSPRSHLAALGIMLSNPDEALEDWGRVRSRPPGHQQG